MIETPPLHRLSATQLATEIAAGRISASVSAQSVLDRISSLDPALRAWVFVDPEQVLAEAAELDAEAAAGRLRGPLHGVPVGVKDIYDVAGMPTQAGSRLLAHAQPAPADAAAVRRLRQAGALIVGKTATTEFASADPAATVNPWNRAHTPGGSSSGSAAAVAAAMVPLALGTQTAGSVLRPASFCGIVGFKPGFGRIPRDGVLPFAWSLDTIGTLTRTVADAALAFEVLGSDSLQRRGMHNVSAASRPPCIGYVPRILPERLHVSMRSMLAGAASRLEEAGATVREARLPADFGVAVDAHQLIMLAEAAAYHARRFPRQLARYGPRIRKQIEVGSLISAASYLDAQRVRRDLFEHVAPLLAASDALLVPSAAGSAPESLDYTGDPAFNAPWTMFGLPAITIYGGADAEGLPLGLQLVGRPGADRELLATAAWCEEVLGQSPQLPEPFR